MFKPVPPGTAERELQEILRMRSQRGLSGPPPESAAPAAALAAVIGYDDSAAATALAAARRNMELDRPTFPAALARPWTLSAVALEPSNTPPRAPAPSINIPFIVDPKYEVNLSILRTLREIQEGMAGGPGVEERAKVPGAGESTQFPTPAGSNWGDLRIAVIDRDHVEVLVKAVRRVVHYSQMGLAKKNSPNPMVPWLLLLVFCAEKGNLTWDSPFADRRNQKNKERLDKALRTFFGIPRSAFQLRVDRKGWESGFCTSWKSPISPDELLSQFRRR